MDTQLGTSFLSNDDIAYVYVHTWFLTKYLPSVT